MSLFKKEDRQEEGWTDGNGEGSDPGQRQQLLRYNNDHSTEEK